MANTVRIRRSSVASKVPTTSDILLGELAVNTYDGKLFIKKSTTGNETGSGVSVVEVGGAGGGSVTIAESAADVLSASSGEISADDPGGDRLVFWDDSAGKLAHATLGTNLSFDGTTLNATGGSGGIDPVIAGMIF